MNLWSIFSINYCNSYIKTFCRNFPLLTNKNKVSRHFGIWSLIRWKECQKITKLWHIYFYGILPKTLYITKYLKQNVMIYHQTSSFELNIFILYVLSMTLNMFKFKCASKHFVDLGLDIRIFPPTRVHSQAPYYIFHNFSRGLS